MLTSWLPRAMQSRAKTIGGRIGSADPSSLVLDVSCSLALVLRRRLVLGGTRLGKFAGAGHRGTEGNHHRLHFLLLLSLRSSAPTALANGSVVIRGVAIWMLFRAAQVGEAQ